MTRASRTAALVVALIALAAVPPAAAQSDRFDDEATVLSVEVPVQVLRNGAPVRGLTRDDFEVRAGGRPQEIVGFEVIDLGDGSPPARAGARLVTRRHFLLLFDLSFSDPASVGRARRAAQQLIDEGLHSTDLVAVGTYSSSGGADLALGFTSDRDQLQLALESLDSAELRRSSRDPLALVLNDWMAGGSPLEGLASQNGTGNKEQRYDEMLQMYRDMQAFQSRDARDQRQSEILALAASLEDMARLMASVPGRKQVVYFSEGFDSSIVTGTEDFARLREIATDSARGEVWRVDNEERYGSTTAQSGLNRMLEAFRRADCAIQAVDIGVMDTDNDLRPRVSGADGLFLLAEGTGGEFYRNFNDLSGAMGELLERTSVTYVLSIEPPGVELDGRFHPLKVKLESGGRGTRLVHRPGFYAPRPFAQQSGAERRLNAAGLVIGGADGGRLRTSVLAAPFPGGAEDAYVPVLLEIDGPSLLADHQGASLPLEIYAYALDAGGAVRDFFAKSLTLDVEKTSGAIRGAGIKFWGDFDLAPGDFVLRVLVRNAITGSTGLSTFPLRVPRFAAREAALLPPLVAEPAGKWLLLREDGALREDVAYPFMRAGSAFVPAARPVVGGAGETPLTLVGYHLGDGSLELAGRLLTADGSEAPGAVVSFTNATESDGAGLERLSGSLRTDGLAAGEYRLEVTVGGRSSSIPVVVKG